MPRSYGTIDGMNNRQKRILTEVEEKRVGMNSIVIREREVVKYPKINFRRKDKEKEVRVSSIKHYAASSSLVLINHQKK